MSIAFARVLKRPAIQIRRDVGSSNLERRYVLTEIGVQLGGHSSVQTGHIMLQDPCTVSVSLGTIEAVYNTGSLIDAKHWNSDASAPCSYIGHLIHQGLKTDLASALLLELENDTEMLRDLVQARNIFPNQFWRTMVVVKNREDSIAKYMIGAPQGNVDREDEMNDRIDEKVELGPEEVPKGLQFPFVGSLQICTR